MIRSAWFISFISFFAFLLMMNFSAQAQAPKYSNEFMAIGVGARALGMSNSYIATVNDVTAGYWNPAGLLGIESNIQLGAMHSEYFAGIAKYDYLSFATRPDSTSAFGVSMVRFAIDGIPNTLDLIDANGIVDYDRVTEFSAADYGFLFSYAKKMKIQGLRLGANAKIIRRKVGDFGGAWGFGLDVGSQYDYKSWRFAAMARDISSTFNAWSYTLTDETKEIFTLTGNEIPENSLEITLPRLLLAAARKFEFGTKFSLLTELDVDATFDGKRNVLLKSNFASLDPHFGFELGFKNFAFLRGGIGNIQYSRDFDNKIVPMFQPNIGVGVKIKALTIDYALTDIGDQSVALYSNVFSLKLDINKQAD